MPLVQLVRKLFGMDHRKNGYPGVFRTCNICGRQHYLTSIELSFYTSEDSAGPRSCRMCRVSPQVKVKPGILLSADRSNERIS